MIKNNRQYEASCRQISKLQDALELSKNHPVKMDKKLYNAMLAGIESQIQDVQKEIDEYEKLQRTKEIPIDTFDNVGQLLIQARIASGYTQKQLAEKIGIQPQVLQKYEACGYETTNIARMKKIIEALDISTLIEFAMPENAPDMKKMVAPNIIWDIKTDESDIVISEGSDWAKANEYAESQWIIKPNKAA